MALSKKSLQRKREMKKKKRQAKVSKLASAKTLNYSSWPIYECWVPRGLWEAGIGQVVVSREGPTGDIVVAIYLLDVFCLGVKNCFFRVLSLEAYQDFLEVITESCGELECVEAIYVNTLIRRAVEYASKLGFSPHSDYVKAERLLRNIPIDEDRAFNFGKEGKPCYISGPNESPAEVRKRIETLESNVGKGNYHFLLEASELLEE
jgi:hypothetical protein